MTKLSDFVIDFLTELNIKHVFVIQGGAIAHLIDSVEKNNKIRYITCQHEQACAMAADAYSRTSNTIGVALATSGPGATNLITGIANAYYDSVPVLYITGNVTSFRQSNGMGIRQYGFQETDIVSIVKPITKYCIRIQNPYDIQYELEKALYEAQNGRKGPVLIDIPDDFQREYINESKLTTFIPPCSIEKNNFFPIDEIFDLLKKSKRPVLVYGSGVISSKAINDAKKVTEKFNIPTLYSWPLKGMFSYDEELNYGSFGTNSLRSGNFIIQNSDLIISVGNRLDTHATGSLKEFAREAKIIIVDIDENELKKFKVFGKDIDLLINEDAKQFLTALNNIDFRFEEEVWINYCKNVKKQFYDDTKEITKFISPQYFMEKLSDICNNETIFIGDTGANLVYLFNSIKEKNGQKFISAFNNTPMGFALPASIGISLANKTKKIICCVGDGGMQMNIQELATIDYYKLPIIIIVFNNAGHGMIKQTQDDWFNSSYSASSHHHGIPKLNFKNIAESYNIESIRISSNSEIQDTLRNIPFHKPYLIELVIDEDLRINPMLKFGRPLEDMNPLLNRDEFLNHMIIQPLEISTRDLD